MMADKVNEMSPPSSHELNCATAKLLNDLIFKLNSQAAELSSPTEELLSH